MQSEIPIISCFFRKLFPNPLHTRHFLEILKDPPTNSPTVPFLQTLPFRTAPILRDHFGEWVDEWGRERGAV